MNILQNLAVKLGITRAEMTAVSLLILFLILGGAVRYSGSVQEADKLIKKAEASRYSEAEVDSLLRLASKVDYGAEEETSRSSGEETGNEQAGRAGQAARAGKKTFTGTIPFNTASASRLQNIPGVGPVMAKKLVTFRAEKGGKVKQFDDFLEVTGIGKKKLEVLKKHLTLE
ncbi:MAG: helix-hairpin-helix domain-containing protein [Chlorobiaceae bacterium]|nr:helix-hairpin-helix domain-containing protein [Chlorobiaceae bacterium]